MSETDNLIPKAENVAGSSSQQINQGTSNQQPAQDSDPQSGQQNQSNVHLTLPETRIILLPGLEYDPRRKFMHSRVILFATILLFLSWVLVEIRDCPWVPGTDITTLQSLHFSLTMLAMVMYVFTLFGASELTFTQGYFFLGFGMYSMIYVVLMIWMTFTAASSPCVRYLETNGALDYFLTRKNVFSHGDSLGILIMFMDMVSSISMILAIVLFFKKM